MRINVFLFIIIWFVNESCSANRIQPDCSDLADLKYTVLRKGYIGQNAEAQGEICFQQKWKVYLGLSKECIIELLGEPMEIRYNYFLYYFGDAEQEMVIGAIKLYFAGNKMNKIKCVIV